MMCQSGLTIFMPRFDNALRTASVTAAGPDGATTPWAPGARGRFAGTRRQPGRHADSRPGRWNCIRLAHDSNTPSRDAPKRGSRLCSVRNVDKKTPKFSKRLLSSSFEPCSIQTLSRANVILRTAFTPTGHGQSAQTPAPLAGYVFLSCGRPATPVAIRGCLSSSSLPPSFARGRRTTVFYSSGVGPVGTDLCCPNGVMT